MEGDFSMSMDFTDVTGSTSSGISGTGTVFTEYSATIVGTDDDIAALYIDWSDGQDPAGNFTNDKRYANYQWVQFTDPVKTTKVKHTYTSTGTFQPMVQVINSNGFASAYYSATATGSLADNYPLPYIQETTVSGAKIVDGQATGVMRVENKTVYAGIDNSIFTYEGARDIFLFIPPTLTQTELGYLNPLKIDIEVELLDSGRSRASNDTVVGGSTRKTTLNVEMSGTNLTNNQGMINILPSGNGATQGAYSALVTGAQVKRVISVKYKNPKYMADKTDYTINNAYNKMKVFICVSSSTAEEEAGDSATEAFRPICYVTPGSPVKYADDKKRMALLDFSQSRAKAANVSLSNYRYDSGHMWIPSFHTWGLTSNTSNYFNDNTKTTNTNLVTTYTYTPDPFGIGGLGDNDVNPLGPSTPWDTNDANVGMTDQYLLDDFGRFADIYHCTRLSVQPASAATNTSAEISTITDNKPYVYRICPFVTVPEGGASNYKSRPVKLLEAGGQLSKNLTTGAWTNIRGGASPTASVDLDALNSPSFVDFSQNARKAEEYLLLLFSKKTNNIFLNMTPYAENMMSDSMTGTSPVAPPWGIGGVYYLTSDEVGTVHSNYTWKPLEYTDGTALVKEYTNTGNAAQEGSSYTSIKASLTKSGPITFSMPSDWMPTTLSGMCAGAFNVDESTDPSAVEVVLTGARSGTAVDTAGFGKSFCFSGAAISDAMETAGFTQPEDVGAWKYVFVPKSTTGADTMDRMYWLASGGTGAGWDGADKIWCHYGDTTNGMPELSETTANSITGSLRRINVYDAVTGFAKGFNAGTTGDIEICPVDGFGTSKNCFNIKTTGASSGIGFDLATTWKSDEYYAIKILLSGAAGTVPSFQTDGTYPNIKNIFDGNRAYHEIIKQVDDSGYSLNSQPITSDVSVTRAGTYYQAVTRKGKVFIQRTGTPITSINFNSIGAGDSKSSTAFADSSASSLYGHLHTMRRVQGESVRVYWDEPQKDSTFVRYWGIVNNVSETHPAGSPRGKIDYSFDMTIEEVALIDGNGLLMTNLFPLGGLLDERNSS
tara:strand:+ start:15613 stop:18780 length:3168 start_codon:yes stop_codon:yes gene_type:complete